MVTGRRWATLGFAVIALAVAFTCGCSGGHPSTSALPPSPGPSAALVTVPDVVGQGYSEKAQPAVALASLMTAYRLDHSSAVVAGVVMSQTPAAGSRVPAQTTVTLVA